jgi:hypothetical protein
MAEKIKIEKKGMLEKEDIVPSAEIKLKDKLGDRVAFAPGYGCGNEPPKIVTPPRTDDPPKCGNEPPVIPPVKDTIKKGKKYDNEVNNL